MSKLNEIEAKIFKEQFDSIKDIEYLISLRTVLSDDKVLNKIDSTLQSLRKMEDELLEEV